VNQVQYCWEVLQRGCSWGAGLIIVDVGGQVGWGALDMRAALWLVWAAGLLLAELSRGQLSSPQQRYERAT
jgi:hypothetical protein